ncbi:ParB N-terminal domain-containing protein [Chloroflexales bacterium ZM16-3]|nr:ParB N-terminal domain-containing protein [Chloroflexales bacterium ZM16-3]
MAPRSKTVAQVIEIGRELIEVDAGQVRQEKTEGLSELAASVKGGNAFPPLVVTDLGKGRYRLLDGERRWLAAGIAGIERVPCIVQAPKGYLDTRVEQMQRNNALPMTPLEWAQGSYHAYLAANIAALASEQGVADPTEGLVEAGLKPTEQRERLEGWLAELAGMPVTDYLTTPKVRVPRRAVFERLGKPTNESAIKKLWVPLKLPAALQDKLEGTGVSTRTMGDLAGLPEDAQGDAVDAALAAAGAEGDVGAALRKEITSRKGEAETEGNGTVVDWPEPDAPTGDGDMGMAALAAGERGDGFVPDPALALPFGGGPGGKGAMHVDGPAPGTGSTPPAGLGTSWPHETVLQFEAGLEALLGCLDTVGPATLSAAQQRLLGSQWRELRERGAKAGLPGEGA